MNVNVAFASVVDDPILMALLEVRGGSIKFPIYPKGECWDEPVDVLMIDTRCMNCLSRAGITNIRQILNVIGYESTINKSAIKGLGASTQEELMRGLFLHQYARLGKEEKDKYRNIIFQLNIS